MSYSFSGKCSMWPSSMNFCMNAKDFGFSSGLAFNFRSSLKKRFKAFALLRLSLIQFERNGSWTTNLSSGFCIVVPIKSFSQAASTAVKCFLTGTFPFSQNFDRRSCVVSGETTETLLPMVYSNGLPTS